MPPYSRDNTNCCQLHHVSPEIIIIGAGIAGSALAYSLSHAGRSCLLIERDLSEPDRIVGELLQPGGVRALSQLGLADVLDGIDAVPVEGYCVVSGGRRVGIPYPDLDQQADEKPLIDTGVNEKGSSETSLVDKKSNANATAPWYVPSASGRKEGRSFHHGRVISALRRKCQYDAPNLTVVEGTVRQLVRCEDSTRVIGITAAFKLASKTPGEESETVVQNIYAPITIVADGCFSKFRAQPGLKLPTPKTRSHFVGVVLKDIRLPIPRHGTVCLTPEGPVLLYQIGNKGEETRMLVDVKGKLPSVADGSLKVSYDLPRVDTS
jgi:squalene monooxygenase